MAQRGLGTGCSTRSLLAALCAALPAAVFASPPNDLREGAPPLAPGQSLSGTTVGATNGGDIASACGLSATSPDVWYRFDCAADSGFALTTCGGSSYDVLLQVFAVAPDGGLGTAIACSDDGAPCNLTDSLVRFSGFAGHGYWVRVSGYFGSSGTFSLRLDADESVPVTPPPHPPQAQPPLPSLPFAPTRASGANLTIAGIGFAQFDGGRPVWMADSNGAGERPGMYAYMFDCSMWNVGDIPVQWNANASPHPVTSEHLYRLKDGRLEQIGVSWLVHGFSSLNGSAFSGMGPCDTPLNGGSQQLGVNCSAEVSVLQLEQSGDYLAARVTSDASAGTASYPFQSAVGPVNPQDFVSRRIVVGIDDLRGDVNAGAYYFAEAGCIAPDDASWGNGRDNYATRILRADTLFTTAVGYFGSTYGRTTAVELWARMDPSVAISRVNFVDSSATFTDPWRHWTGVQPYAVQLPPASWTTVTADRNARFIVASRAIDAGGGLYDYEYAVLNVNSTRAGASFALRVPAGAATQVGFRAPMYHSGDRVLNNPWEHNGGAGGVLRWTVNPATASYTPPGMGAPVAFGPNTLMWGTMYNFRFRSQSAPTVGVARIGLTPPRDPTGYQASLVAANGVKTPAVCVADMGSAAGFLAPDGFLDNNDFIAFIGAFFDGDLLMADVGKPGGLDGGDNALDNNDFIVFINQFFAGCG